MKCLIIKIMFETTNSFAPATPSEENILLQAIASQFTYSLKIK